MTLAEVSVRRPVLTIVISALITIFGAISLKQLGIREYPAAPVAWLSDVTDARYVVSDMMSKIINDNMAVDDAQKWAQDQMMDSYNKLMKKA